MSLAKKLKGDAAQEAPKTNANACKCGGVLFPTQINLAHDNGVLWGTVCCKLTCLACGRVKERVADGKTVPALYRQGDKGVFFFNPENFWVPRELVEEPVFDKSGAPVLDREGKHILSFNKNKKMDFLRRLMSLIVWKKPRNQTFTLSEIMNAKPNNNYF